MTTVSVPLKAAQEEKVNNLVRGGIGANRADVIRRAIDFYAEEQAIRAVLEAEAELNAGKILRGDLRKIMKKLNA